MTIVGDNSNTVGSLTISNDMIESCGTDWYRGSRAFENMFPMIWHHPTTDGDSPVSNAITESYVNVLLPYRIDRVIFHDPATVVYWKDGTKTVVKCHDEPFDREKGLAMCIAKKVLGKDFHKTFRGWCE